MPAVPSGQPWSESEHLAFITGLKKLGKGNWRGISRYYVPSRTPTQVASHAQKHFMRLNGVTKRKSRFSLLEQAVRPCGPLSQASLAEGSPCTVLSTKCKLLRPLIVVPGGVPGIASWELLWTSASILAAAAPSSCNVSSVCSLFCSIFSPGAPAARDATPPDSSSSGVLSWPADGIHAGPCPSQQCLPINSATCVAPHICPYRACSLQPAKTPIPAICKRTIKATSNASFAANCFHTSATGYPSRA